MAHTANLGPELAVADNTVQTWACPSFATATAQQGPAQQLALHSWEPESHRFSPPGKADRAKKESKAEMGEYQEKLTDRKERRQQERGRCYGEFQGRKRGTSGAGGNETLPTNLFGSTTCVFIITISIFLETKINKMQTVLFKDLC